MKLPVLVAAFAAATLWASLPSFAAAADELPTPDHVIVVMMENHSFRQIMEGGGQTPFLRLLGSEGANFVNAFAITHPSEPNYFALFSGSTQGVRDDGKHSFDAPTLAGALAGAHKTFIGYIEAGSPRKHNPWESFANSQAVEQTMARFPDRFAALPTVAFVVPGLAHDMHDGTIAQGDRWVEAHLAAYAHWAQTHNSLLIVTFDEDDDGAANRIPTIIVGDHVVPGRYAQRISHYTVLRTILAMYRLRPFANAIGEQPITGIWRLDKASPAETAARGAPPS
ncbi:MAG TPA: alkaline phosphatase family protein [Stellaceae bacterium]|nr:alkaline phosphatase family protein [Stellaceae bacterium]